VTYTTKCGGYGIAAEGRGCSSVPARWLEGPARIWSLGTCRLVWTRGQHPSECRGGRNAWPPMPRATRGAASVPGERARWSPLKGTPVVRPVRKATGLALLRDSRVLDEVSAGDKGARQTFWW